MFHPRRGYLFATVAALSAATACSSSDHGSSGLDAGAPCTASFSTSDAGQPATITIDSTTVVNSFVPKLLFGVNSAWYLSKVDVQSTQPKIQAAGNFTLRYPGGSSSDDFHWNGTGNYDSNHYWVPSATGYTAGFKGSEMYRGTTSGGYQTQAFITDNDPTTMWLSNVDRAFPAAQWAYVDLGSAKSVDSLQMTWGTPYATSFKVQTWSSPAAWPPPYQATGSATWQDTSAGPLTGVGGAQTVTFTAVSTQFIRVLMSASSAGANGAYAIAELKAYNGATQVTNNVSSTSQSATTVSSTDPANHSVQQVGFDFESFMTYLQSFSPAADAVITTRTWSRNTACAIGKSATRWKATGRPAVL